LQRFHQYRRHQYFLLYNKSLSNGQLVWYRQLQLILVQVIYVYGNKALTAYHLKIAGPALAVSVLALLPSHLKHLGFLIDAISYLLAFFLLIGIKNVDRKIQIPNKRQKKAFGVNGRADLAL